MHSILQSNTTDAFKLVDDVWFSGHLALKGVPRIVVFPAVEMDQPAYQRLASFGRSPNKTDEERLLEARGNAARQGTSVDGEPGLRTFQNVLSLGLRQGALLLQEYMQETIQN